VDDFISKLLEAEAEIYFRVVEASPDAIIVIDGDGIVRLFNTQAELLFGHDRLNVLRHPVEMLMPDEFKDRHVVQRTNYFQEPRVREMGDGMIIRGMKRSGEVFTAQIKLAPIVTPKSGMLALAVVRRVRDV